MPLPPLRSQLKRSRDDDAPLPSFRFDILQHLVRMCVEDLDAGSTVHRVPLFYHATEDTVALYDAFPKASAHLLLLPRATSKGTAMRLTDLTVGHLPMLQEMQTLANGIMAAAADVVPCRRWLVGFHAVPSLFHLHCHVLTVDWERSASWKTKKHYNSFTTKFFVPLSVVIAQGKSMTDPSMKLFPTLEEKPLKALLDGDMRCWWCNDVMKTVPSAKNHLSICSRRPEK